MGGYNSREEGFSDATTTAFLPHRGNLHYFIKNDLIRPFNTIFCQFGQAGPYVTSTKDYLLFQIRFLTKP